MKTLFNVYRTLAFVVGVLLIILTTGVALKYLATQGTSAQHLGDDITFVVGVTHGWLYIAYVVTAFILAARARWSLLFTLLALAAGLIPLLIFWVERQVSNRMHEDHPELFTAGSRATG